MNGYTDKEKLEKMASAMISAVTTRIENATSADELEALAKVANVVIALEDHFVFD